MTKATHRPVAGDRSAEERFNLGLLLEERGDTVPAAAAYRLAAEASHAGAALNLGVLLEASGDLSGAERWYRQARSQGDPHAVSNLVAVQDRQRRSPDAPGLRPPRLRAAPSRHHRRAAALSAKLAAFATAALVVVGLPALGASHRVPASTELALTARQRQHHAARPGIGSAPRIPPQIAAGAARPKPKPPARRSVRRQSKPAHALIARAVVPPAASAPAHPVSTAPRRTGTEHPAATPAAPQAPAPSPPPPAPSHPAPTSPPAVPSPPPAASHPAPTTSPDSSGSGTVSGGG